MLLRDRRLWILAAWSLWFWVVMVAFALGELPSGRWIINVTNVHYWYPIFPALAMSGLGGLWLLVRRYSPPRRGLFAAELAVLALAALILLPGVAEFRSCAPRTSGATIRSGVGTSFDPGSRRTSRAPTTES